MRALLASVALVLAAPGVAHGAGGGLTAGFGGEGATRPGNPHTYVTLAAGRASVLLAINKGSGAIDRRRRLPGLFGAPQVTHDGAKTGLSLDGRTLVLSDVPHAWPIRRTRLLVLDAPRLQVRQRIDLQGWYSVDGLSPDGRVLFLVHYLTPSDASEVVAYDRADGSRRVVVKLSGRAVSRVTSGGSEYTLYARRDAPFVQALDTQAGTAERIALPRPVERDLSTAKLQLDGDDIAIGTLATLDPRTRRVTLVGADREDAVPWPLIGLGLAALAAIVIVGLRRRPAQQGDDLELTVHVDEGGTL